MDFFRRTRTGGLTVPPGPVTTVRARDPQIQTERNLIPSLPVGTAPLADDGKGGNKQMDISHD